MEQVPLEHSSHRVSFMEQSSQRLPFLEQTICHVPLLEQSPYHVPPLSEQSPQRLSLSDQSPHHVPFLEQSPHHLPLLEQSTQRLAPQQHLPEHQAENTASVLPVPATGVSIQESVLSEHDSVQPQAMQELVTASCEGLVFVLQSIDHVEEVNAQQAITSLAQGSVKCCMTGPAFEVLLQAEAAVVHAVMSSVVVFARMRGQQKGQVMDLLGRRGIHLTLQGQQRYIPGLGATCMYCGDGVNDLVALAAADVGMAVGSSSASAGAAISDEHASVEGVVSVLLEARAAQVIKLSAIKFMVAYQLLMSIGVNFMLYIDGSEFSVVQRSLIDFVAISLGIVMSLRRAASQLTFERPPQVLCTTRNNVQMLISIFIPCMAYLGMEKYLQRHDFWQDLRPDTSSPSLTLAWLIAINNTLLPVITFVVDVYGFCKTISIPEIALFAVYKAFCVVSSTIGPAWFDVTNLFHFYPMPFYFQWRVYGYGIGFIACYLLTFWGIRIAWDIYG